MEAVAGALLITYFVGYVASLFVMPWRAGVPKEAWLVAFLHPGSRRNGIPWAIVSYGKVLVWPIVFAVWLMNDRPPSRVLYGRVAAERLYGDPDRALPGFLTKWKAP